MTNYQPTAFGADQITRTHIFDTENITPSDLTDDAVRDLVEDIPTSETVTEPDDREEEEIHGWLKTNFITESSLAADRLSFSLEDPETTSPNGSNTSYRGRFMRGKEKEYAATMEAYGAMTGSKFNGNMDSLAECRKFATFKREKMSGEVKVFSSACRDRWCVMCAGSKASFAKEQTRMYIESLQTARFLTLTLKHNTDDLKSQIEFLTDRFCALRRRAFWKKHVTGGIWFLQIKRGRNSGCWHPHLHILLDGESMVQGRLSELWEQVTFGSPVLDIRKVHDVENLAEYVARYCARPAMLKDMPLADRVEVITALYGKRTCGTFGTGKTVTLTPPKIEACGEWSDIGYYDEVARKAKTDPMAKEVLKAYYNDTPLSEELFESFTGSPVFPEYVPYGVRIGPQAYLDFF